MQLIWITYWVTWCLCNYTLVSISRYDDSANLWPGLWFIREMGLACRICRLTLSITFELFPPAAMFLQADVYHCPQCLQSRMPPEARLHQMKCNLCFECPVCQSVMSLRAITQPGQAGASPARKDKEADKVSSCKTVYQRLYIEVNVPPLPGWHLPESAVFFWEGSRWIIND